MQILGHSLLTYNIKDSLCCNNMDPFYGAIELGLLWNSCHFTKLFFWNKCWCSSWKMYSWHCSWCHLTGFPTLLGAELIIVFSYQSESFSRFTNGGAAFFPFLKDICVSCFFWQEQNLMRSKVRILAACFPFVVLLHQIWVYWHFGGPFRFSDSFMCRQV